MVDRQEVEAILQLTDEGMDSGRYKPVTMLSVQASTLAALCRAWLAVEKARAALDQEKGIGVNKQ